MKELTNERVGEALGWKQRTINSRQWWTPPDYEETLDTFAGLPNWLHSNELAVRDVLPVLRNKYHSISIHFDRTGVMLILHPSLFNNEADKIIGRRATLSEALCAALLRGEDEDGE